MALELVLAVVLDDLLAFAAVGALALASGAALALVAAPLHLVLGPLAGAGLGLVALFAPLDALRDRRTWSRTLAYQIVAGLAWAALAFTGLAAARLAPVESWCSRALLLVGAGFAGFGVNGWTLRSHCLVLVLLALSGPPLVALCFLAPAASVATAQQAVELGLALAVGGLPAYPLASASRLAGSRAAIAAERRNASPAEIQRVRRSLPGFVAAAGALLGALGGVHLAALAAGPALLALLVELLPAPEDSR